MIQGYIVRCDGEVMSMATGTPGSCLHCVKTRKKESNEGSNSSSVLLYIQSKTHYLVWLTAKLGYPNLINLI